MRTKTTTTAAALALLGALTLAGCSGGTTTAEPAATKGGAESAAAEQKTAEPTKETSSDCPELKEGATIDVATFTACVDEAMSNTAGFATKASGMGMDSTAKRNPKDREAAVDMTTGSLVVIGDDAWVKSAVGEWAPADPTSTDPIIQGLSAAATQINSVSISGIAEGSSGTLTVTGTDKKLGTDVFVTTGEITLQGIAMESTYYLSANYAPLMSIQKAVVNGTDLTTTNEITEWDKKQDIAAPL